MLLKNKLFSLLLIHNYYRSANPSGENMVVQIEKELLESRLHRVKTFEKKSDTLVKNKISGLIKGALATPWNPFTYKEIRRCVKAYKPDLIHAHNTFPLISPSVFWGIGSLAPKVLTLHNYRIFCPAAIPMRDGKVCTECLDSLSVWPGLKHGCYRESIAATLPMAFCIELHRRIGTWETQVDAFIALSDFQKDVMCRAGLPKEKVFVKPNFYPGNPKPISWPERNRSVVFAGRLSPEKGVYALISAWLAWGKEAPELSIMGDGPDRCSLEKLASSSFCNVKFLGQVASEEAQKKIAKAKLLVLPSEWFEGFPMVIREAFAFGTPAAVSSIGPLPSIVKHGVNGLVFEPRNPDSLLNIVKGAWKNECMLEALSREARKSFETRYTENVNYKIMMDIYQHAIENHKRRVTAL